MNYQAALELKESFLTDGRTILPLDVHVKIVPRNADDLNKYLEDFSLREIMDKEVWLYSWDEDYLVLKLKRSEGEVLYSHLDGAGVN